jgi:hypothetical protein
VEDPGERLRSLTNRGLAVKLPAFLLQSSEFSFCQRHCFWGQRLSKSLHRKSAQWYVDDDILAKKYFPSVHKEERKLLGPTSIVG